MFTIGQQITVSAHTPSAATYNARHGIPEGTPVPATIVTMNGVFIDRVVYPDGMEGSPATGRCEPVTEPTPAEVIGADNRPRTFERGDIVTVTAEALARYGHANNVVEPADTEHGTVTEIGRVAWDGAEYDYRVSMSSDGCGVPANADEMTLVAAETPANAPVEPVDALDAWEAGLTDSDAVLAEIWQAADNAASAASACAEYEATVAYPHGHAGRDGYQPDEDSDQREAGTVTFRRTITRTITVVQELEVNLEAGEDAYDALADCYDEWENIDGTEEYGDEERDDYGPEVYDDDRGYLPAGPNEEVTQPADLVRAALESDTSYQSIRDAILRTAREHGAPIAQKRTASIAAVVSRQQDGAWSAPAQERRNDAPVSSNTALALENPRTYDAYDTARWLLQGGDDTRPARIAHGTLAVVLASTWSVTS